MMTAKDAPDLPLDLGRGPDTEAPFPPQRRGWFRKRYLLVLLIPVFMFSGAVIGMYFQPPALQKFYALTGLQPGGGASSPIALPPEIELPEAMAQTLLPTDVVGLARLMPRGDVAIVAAPYGAGDARVAEILVSVGDIVARGAPLARLDNRDALEGAVLTAQATLAVCQATLAQTRSAVAASRAEAQATLARFAAGQIDDQPDVVVAARNVAAAEAEVARARMDMDRAEVRAPIDGTILDIHATPGQRPPAEGIMEMGNTDVMMAEVEIWQDRIASVAAGQPVELAAPALGQSLRGTVQSIGLTVGRQGLISDDAAANSDARVIRVLVALDAASSPVAARYVGLEAVARIDTGAAARATQ